MGGRFDPPHLGHREAVRGLFQIPRVKRVLILPSGNPPHKKAIADPKDRVQMAKLNFGPTVSEDFPSEIELDLREIERAHSNPLKPNYSYDTLQELRTQIPSIAFVVGADQLCQLITWNRFPDILKLCHWIVLGRKPDGADLAQKTLSEWAGSCLVKPVASSGNHWQVTGSSVFLTTVPTSAPSLSSTQIREELAKSGKAPAGSLLPEVEAYLKLRRLYGI
jgi:nicotinate-nucleotide adenylyltransferase